MKSHVKTLLVGAALLAMGGFALAHHSFAMFDQSKKIVLKGSVKEYQWTNPHVWIQIMAPDSTGAMVEWSVEAQSLNNLKRLGWSRKSFAAGDAVEITINPLRSGERGGSFVRAILANGTTLEGREAPAGTAAPAGKPTAAQYTDGKDNANSL